MSKQPTVLRDLLRRRHWQTYATFCRQYDQAARHTDPTLVGRWPSRGQFARWLSGDVKGLPHPDHCRILETMFAGVSARELFTAAEPAGPSAGHPGDGPPAATPTAAPRHPAHLPPPGPATPAAGGNGLVPHQVHHPERGGDGAGTAPSDSPAGPPYRGSAGPPVPAPVGPGHPLHEEIAMATEESARFVRGVRGSVDHDVLDQLNADVRQLAVDYLSRPPLALFRPLARLRLEVFELLDQRQRPALLPPLYAVAGRLCALLAHASADLGHGYAAETHTRTAWLCADLADDDSLRAYVRWVQANVAFWGGDHVRAAQLAHSGQRHATKGTNLLRLASQEARAWAARGDGREVERALAVAATAGEHEPDEQAGVFRFDPGKAAYYASEVRLALGGRDNARRAVTAAEESLLIFAAGPEAHSSPEFVAAARLDLANARLSLDDLDGAAEQLRIVLTLPVESRTQPIVSRVTSAGDTLVDARFTRSSLAQDLREEIALFRAYPAHRDLPEVFD